MKRITIDGFAFDFADDWKATKFDDWAFYRRHFIRAHDGIKAVDLLAFSPEKTLYLIEVKDYRRNRRDKTIPLVDEIILKVCWTLAALLPTGVNGANADESSLARTFLEARKLSVVLHLEQPATPSKLFPQLFKPADVRQKLKQKLRSIDPHPNVVEARRMGRVAGKWSVSAD